MTRPLRFACLLVASDKRMVPQYVGASKRRDAYWGQWSPAVVDRRSYKPSRKKTVIGEFLTFKRVILTHPALAWCLPLLQTEVRKAQPPFTT
jgi:hypothetical protein